MALLVMKFGGSLTADARKLARVAGVIAAEALAWDQIVVVVSAMGGVTDAFRRAVESAEAGHSGGSGYRRIVALIREKHITLLDTLIADLGVRQRLITLLDHHLYEVLSLCDRIARERGATARDRDRVMAVGEQVMAAILTALVRVEGLTAVTVDAESVIITDEVYQNANPLIDLIEERAEAILRPLLEAKITPILPGFVGATRRGVITTLGRGGSDYTATLLAAALRADEVWLWTHVDGIMSTDPAIVPGARVIPLLSYGEVEELAYFGTRLLHPDAIEPLAPRGIPLRVRNPDNLDHAGTLIQAEAQDTGVALKAVTAVDGLAMTLNGQPLDLAAFLVQIHHTVGQAARGPVIVLHSHHHTTLTFVVPTSEGPDAAGRVAATLRGALPKWEIAVVKVIAAFGSGTVGSAPISVPVLSAARGMGGRRLFAVEPIHMKDAVRQLHKLTESSTIPMLRQIFPEIKR
ncbi:MAG TPA: aspartate kinase [Aggregatilineales bacterium]|nr:aspartate kinase [Anaerolineales bacterium]HRE48289.1 aspartate kinase [Aggregatilineales bacterium]